MFGFGISVILGVCLGFGFGVGCALAVMYSVFLGGYRAALRDARLPVPPRRLREQSAKVAGGSVDL